MHRLALHQETRPPIQGRRADDVFIINDWDSNCGRVDHNWLRWTTHSTDTEIRFYRGTF